MYFIVFFWFKCKRNSNLFSFDLINHQSNDNIFFPKKKKISPELVICFKEFGFFFIIKSNKTRKLIINMNIILIISSWLRWCEHILFVFFKKNLKKWFFFVCLLLWINNNNIRMKHSNLLCMVCVDKILSNLKQKNPTKTKVIWIWIWIFIFCVYLSNIKFWIFKSQLCFLNVFEMFPIHNIKFLNFVVVCLFVAKWWNSFLRIVMVEIK